MTIAAEQPVTVAWVNLTDVVWDDQPIDEPQVQFYADLLAGHTGHLSLPVLNADLTVRDGRHRLLAHQRVGRTVARVNIVHNH